MTHATVDGLSISYDVVGSGDGQTWAVTPGGRYSKDTPGIRQLATALAEGTGGRALIWDRPNTGASDVCFTGESESVMQADALGGLIRQLGFGPTIIAGGSGGSRVSMLTAARHRDLASGLAIWWITGGVYGLMSLGVHYCSGSFIAAWKGGMEAVAALPEWAEVIEASPGNRDRILAQDPKTFMTTIERWMAVYCPDDSTLVPGLSDADAAKLDLPTLVLRSGASDIHHRRETSEKIAAALPNAILQEPPWGDTEWADRHTPEATREGLFARWPLLAPQLLDWYREAKI
jgi:pimeloyl-ACP methyl ester carboxylesterase